MHFDIRTLLVAVALATVCCAGARVMLWRMHPTIPGPGRWAAASLLAAVGIALIAVGSAAAFPLAWSLAQVVMMVGVLLAWDGFRRFVGKGGLSLLTLLGWTLLALVPLLIVGLTPSLMVRSATNTTVVAVVSALIARELVAAARPGRTAMRVTGWLYAANATFFLVRAATILSGAVPNMTEGPNSITALPLFWWLCVAVAVTLGMALMISERLQADLDRQASCDPLTGALNRRAFAVVAEREVARARRHGQPLSVLMMDLDHFKQINDRLGHGAGDDVLRGFVAAARRTLRAEDVLCRFGGEEFVALLPGTFATRALGAAERLRTIYVNEKADLSRQLPLDITVSIGVAALAGGEDIEDVIRRADAALYRAKAQGRNRCEVADDDSAVAVGCSAAV